MQPYVLSSNSPNGRFTAEARVTYGLFEILGGTGHLTLRDNQSGQMRAVREWESAGWIDGEWPTGIEWKDDGRRVAFLLQIPELGGRGRSGYQIKWNENGFAVYDDSSTFDWFRAQIERKVRVGSPPQRAKYSRLVRQFYRY